MITIPEPLNAPVIHRPYALQAHPIVRETRMITPLSKVRDYSAYTPPAHARLYPGRAEL